MEKLFFNDNLALSCCTGALRNHIACSFLVWRHLKRLALKYGKVYFHLLPGDVNVKRFLLDPPSAAGLVPVTVKWNVGSNYTR